MSLNFVALDFETADYQSDSACAIGLVKVENGKIAEKAYHLVRPPRRRVMFTEIHGIRWEDVADQPAFPEIWSQVKGLLKGAAFVAAHNAGFDRKILMGCCKAYGIEAPVLEFVCTVKLARSAWSIYPTKLPDVCRKLNIELQHHQALSDAEACARIVVAAHEDGLLPSTHQENFIRKEVLDARH